MRLSVFRCPGPTPVVTALSRESRAQTGALVVIHPFCGQLEAIAFDDRRPSRKLSGDKLPSAGTELDG
jgi:hypothetical protein